MNNTKEEQNETEKTKDTKPLSEQPTQEGLGEDIKQDQTENLKEKKREDVELLMNTNPNITVTKQDNENVNPVNYNNQIPLLLNGVLMSTDAVISTNLTNNRPLSDYEFNHLGNGGNANATSTIFKMITEFPQMFRYELIQNSNQSINELQKQGPLLFDDVKTITDSVNLFNARTMSVRITLNTNIVNMEITDPNDLAQKAIKLRSIEPIARYNPQTKVNKLESEIRAFIDIFLALKDKLVIIPSKTTIYEVTRSDEASSIISKYPLYDSNAPHIFYSLYGIQPEWYITEMNKLFKQNQFQIGEYGVISRAGRKLASKVKVVTDQFTSSVLHVNYSQLRDNQLRIDDLCSLLDSMTLENDQVEIEDFLQNETMTLLYSFSDIESQLAMIRHFSSINRVNTTMQMLHEAITNTNRLWHREIDDVWIEPRPSELLGSQFSTTFLKNVNVGSKMSAIDMLIFECFADRIDFRIQHYSNPKGPEAIIEIMNIYLFIKLYPRIAQKSITQLGHRLAVLYSLFLPHLWKEYVHQYGMIVSKDGKIRESQRSTPLSMVDSRAGYTYSHFMPTKNKNQGKKNMNAFVSFLQKMVEFSFPKKYEYELDKKRKANLPYLYANYTAQMSWPKTEDTYFSTGSGSSFSNDVSLLISNGAELVDLYTKASQLKSTLPKPFVNQYNSWSNMLLSIAESIDIPFTITMRRFQEMIFNSPFYYGDQFNADTPYPFVPKEVGFAPDDNSSQLSTIRLKSVEVNKLNISVAFNHLLTLEGESYRPLLNPTQGKLLGVGANMREDMSSVNAVGLLNYYYAIVDEAKNFGYAMQLAQWLLDPKRPENPIQKVAHELSIKYMRMAQWVPWLRSVFEKFGVNYDEIFEDIIGSSAIALDNRSMDSTLVLLDPTMNTPIESPVDSFFGKNYKYIDDYDLQKMDIIARPIIRNASVVNTVRKGWYFGQLLVDELNPTQLNLKHLWDDETDISQVIFLQEDYKSGFRVTLNYVSSIDNVERRYVLPYNSQGPKKLLIRLKSFSNIDLKYLKSLARGIALGNVILYVENLRIKVMVQDKSSLTDDYSESMPTENEILDILRTPNHQILERMFYTTTYATNYTENVAIVSTYFQLFATPQSTDDSLFCSVLSNSIEKPENCVLPTSDMLGYGPDQDGFRLPDDTLKINSKSINFNNSIPCIGENLTTSVKINLIPKVFTGEGAGYC